ncbi:MAG: hypothetical protein LBN38_07975 [Verrucomicrobiota bacterium]|nr:hypothetical protein [Verrucomicrobiota bacterium]
MNDARAITHQRKRKWMNTIMKKEETAELLGRVATQGAVTLSQTVICRFFTQGCGMFCSFHHGRALHCISRRARYVSASVMLCILFVMQSCSPRVSGVPLMDGFLSYMTIEECERLLSPTYQLNVRGDIRKPVAEQRPQHGRLILSVDSYTTLGQTGELRLSFSENRLVAIWFYPSDFEAYSRELGKQLGIHVHPGLKTKLGRYAKLWCVSGYREQVIVGWQDKRLVKELSKRQLSWWALCRRARLTLSHL